jgi:adenine phosphoribosyltransferase
MGNYDYEKLIYDIVDYPEPGVVFKDITPLIGDPQGFAAAVDEIAEHFMGRGITKVLGAEARGFLIGAPVAYRLGCGFVPARKPGKLPREVYTASYSLEYGTDELQIHKDAVGPGDKVLIVDDLIATGGTSIACARIVEEAGAEFCGFAYLMELGFLNPRELIAKEYPQEVFSLFVVE